VVTELRYTLREQYRADCARKDDAAMSVTLAIPTDREAILRLLRTEGYRITQPRIAIVDAVFAQGGSFTADGLYDALRDQAGVGRATVFRTLDTLERLGYLRRLHGLDDCHQYVRATPGHHHHLVCTRCGCVVEFDGCTVGAMVDTVAARTQFRIENHNLELYGICPECQTPTLGV